MVVCLRPFIDDGAVYYLNGVEVFRLGMPNVPVTYATLANRTVDDAGFEGPFYVCVTNLVNGDNVLAVELHQQGLGSSDLTFGTELGLLLTVAPPRLTIAAGPAANQVTVTWTGSGVLQRSTNLGTHPTGWANVSGVVGNSYTTTASGNQFFRLAPGP